MRITTNENNRKVIYKSLRSINSYTVIDLNKDE